MNRLPDVSVVVAVCLSEATLESFLDALSRQTLRDFETILVDSGPTEACERIVAPRYEPLVYVRSAGRLLPQAARNARVDRSRGRLLVFTDPDVYAAPDWLERLVVAHGETGDVVVGALACHGSRWLDRGIHLCKFSKWLPGGERRPVDTSRTANMLLARALFEETGRFHGDRLVGDATLSRDLLEAGRTLLFEPRAVVEHHHLETVRSFVRERWFRGICYGSSAGAGCAAGSRCSSRCSSGASFLCASSRTSPVVPGTPPAAASSAPSCRRSRSSSSASAHRSWESRRVTRKRFSAPRAAPSARRR